jgi:parallel beta-helix repeat protein
MVRMKFPTKSLMLFVFVILSGIMIAPIYAQDAPTALDGDPVGPEALDPITVCPRSAVRLLPSQEPQQQVDLQQAGVTYCFTAGVYENVTITPKSGDTYIGLDGAVLDGGGVTTSAFRAVFSPNADDIASDVRIVGLTIQNYADAPTYRDELTPRGAIETGEDWIIEYNLIQDNQTGITLGYSNWAWGDGTIVRHNRIINNSYIGIESQGSNIVFEYNELAGNGWNLTDEERIWSGGGSKFTDQGVWADDSFNPDTTITRERDGQSLIIRRNYIHSNLGHGIWLDIDNRNAVIEDNVFERNYGSGFFDELSNGTIVRRNIFRDNRSGNSIEGFFGGGEIMIANSQAGDIYENDITVSATSRAVVLIFEDYRGEFPGQDYTVRDNVIRFLNAPEYDGNQPLQGVVGAFGDLSVYLNNNRFDGNTYYIPDRSGNHFFWGQAFDWAGFRNVGQEANGVCFVGDDSSETPC